MTQHETRRLLGGGSASAFLRDHWRQKPLFVRNAVPNCGEWLQRNALFELAMRDDVESRIVTRHSGGWHVAYGPFTKRQLVRQPARGWTLLVQGVEQFMPEAESLLRQFSFMPHARLDDLMVSYAAPGGGVGPHFDSYDVFLLQGAGSRRWRISAQTDLALVDDLPLRILKRFCPRREWRVETGDLLYLPPRYAHEGVALSDCMTLSVGFRAPRKQELATNFLEYLQDYIALDGMIDNAQSRPQQHPARLPPSLLRQFVQTLARLRWRDDDVARFAGCYLTEPKARVVFERPSRVLSPATLAKRVAQGGVRLALPSRMLYSGKQVFINGECHVLAAQNRDAIIRLADTRITSGFAPSVATARQLHAWYKAGYVHV